MSFKLNVAEFAKAVGLDVGTVKRKLALDILKSLVLRTPVDTGRARGNWQATAGSPASDTVNKLDKTGVASIGSGASGINKAVGDVPIFITNNLPYIIPLEHGHSKQAPAGMVAVTMASVQAFMAKAIAGTKFKP